MNNRIIKLTESELFELVNKVIAEQTANDSTITVAGEFGQINNQFGALKTFVEEITNKVNQKLQGETPYIVRLIKKSTHTGISSEHGKSGDQFFMKINFAPTDEKNRYYYFTCAAAIYSEAVDYTHLDSEVGRKAVRKTDSWPAEKIYSLGMDLYDLKDFQNLNPAAPDKKYKLLIKYYAGTKPPQSELPNQPEMV
jgi:hypothetical protein